MRRAHLWTVVTAGLMLASSVVGGAPQPPEKDRQKIVYLGDSGPVMLELRILINGKPVGSAYEAFLDRLFRDLDRDGNGTLDLRETASAPTAQVLQSPLTGLGFFRQVNVGVPERPKADSTREMLEAHYRRTGLPPFQLVAAQDSRLVLPRRLGQPNEPSGEELTDRLFQLLDGDHDGKLSREELNAASALLGARDSDEDEMVAPDEVMAGGDRSSQPRPQLVEAARRPSVWAALGEVLLMRAGAEESIKHRIEEQYGKKVSRGWSNEQAPDLNVTVRLGNRSGKPAVTLEEGTALPPGMAARPTPEGVMIQLGRNRLELTTTEQPQDRLFLTLRSQLENRFQASDTDGNGNLDRGEARRSGMFEPLFDPMDRNGDGKVTKQEMLTYIDWIQAMSQLLRQSSSSMRITKEGKGLFDLLDLDHDGRLSVRELRQAKRLLEQHDLDGDGKLSRTEIPRIQKAAVALGPNGGQDPFQQRVLALGSRMAPPGRAQPNRGPLWFQKLDRNRDGDVSRKEFVGTVEQFAAIDTDADGLLSLEEAERYDPRARNSERRR